MRTLEHKQALEKVVLGQFSPKKPCDHKENRPPGAAALAERAKLLGPPARSLRSTWTSWPRSSTPPSPGPRR